MRTLLVTSALLLTPLAPAARAFACTCAPPLVPEELSGAVFEGTALTVEPQPDHSMLVTFSVTRSWAVVESDTFQVLLEAGAALCGPWFVEGESYIVFTDGADEFGPYVTRACSPTRPSNDEQREALGEPRWLPGAPDEEPADGTEEPTQEEPDGSEPVPAAPTEEGADGSDDELAEDVNANDGNMAAPHAPSLKPSGKKSGGCSVSEGPPQTSALRLGLLSLAAVLVRRRRRQVFGWP